MSKPNSKIIYLLAFFGYFSITFCLNEIGGAFSSGLAGASDEPAHMVAIMMIRDYFISGNFTNPLNFATEYYNQYPKMGLGNWPPLFYMLGALWTAIFGRSLFAVMLLITSIGALELWTIFLLLKKRFSNLLSWCLPLLLFSVREWQKYLTMILIDHAIAFLVLLLIIIVIDCLQLNRPRDYIKLGLVTIIGLFTKGNFLFTGIFLPAAFFFFGDQSKFKKLIISTILPFAFAACWYGFAIKYTLAACPERIDQLDYIIGFIKTVTLFLTDSFGWPLLVLFIALVAGIFYKPNSENLPARIAFTAFATYLIFHAILQTGYDTRHYITLLVLIWVILLLTLPRSDTGLTAGVTASILFFVLCINPNFYLKDIHGYDRVVDYIRQSDSGSKILISSDPFGEGDFIANLVLKDVSRNFSVIRASKILGESTWTQNNYKLQYQSENELISLLRNSGADWLILDASADIRFTGQHHTDLTALVKNQEIFRLVQSYDYKARHKLFPGGLQLFEILMDTPMKN